MSSDEDLLSAALDGELGPDEQELVDRLVADDPEAARAQRELRSVRTALRDLPPVEPPDGFFAGLLAGGLGDEAGTAGDDSPGVTTRPDGSVVSLDDARRARRSQGGRRWALGALGAAAAVVAFVVLAGVVPLTDPVTPPVAAFADRHHAMEEPEGGAGPTGDEGYEPMPLADLDTAAGGVSAPVEVEGFTRAQAWANDRTYHVLYRRGPTVVSLYTMPGDLDRSGLPAGDEAPMPAGPAWVGTAGGDQVVVFDTGTAVVTVVSGLPAAEVVAWVGQLTVQPPGVAERMADASYSLTRTFGLD